MMMLGRFVPFLTVAILAATASAQFGDVLVGTQWVFETDAAHPGGTVHAALQVRLDKEYHVNSNKPDEDFLIPTVLTVTAPEGFTVSKIVYPEPIMLKPAFSEVPMSVFEREFVIGVVLEISEETEPGTYSIKGELAYQACNDKYCLAPATKQLSNELRVVPASQPISKIESSLFGGIDFRGAETRDSTPDPEPQDTVPTEPDPADFDIMAALADFTILQTAGGYLNPNDFIAFVDAAESGKVQSTPFQDMGPLMILLLVILGGIALNLTPCVLPLIPINIAIIGAGAQAGSRARGFALGGTYGLAMAAVYGALGLVVILTASTFGAINSTLWFNVGITILFIVLGLAMLDVLAIDFSKLQSKLDLTGKGKRGTFALAFGMGGISALLAGACVAPVVIQVIVYSADQYDKGTQIALALPFFLGLGMALPWPFAGAGLSVLPKPGTWMVRVKQAMGIFILAFAVYYGYLAWKIYDSTNVDSAEVMASVEANLAEEGWTASAYRGLAQAKAQDKLVFIDMWAIWCKACVTMNKTTLKNDEVVARLEDYVKIKYEAPDPDAPPAIDVLHLFDQIGLPAYAILKPKNDAVASN